MLLFWRRQFSEKSDDAPPSWRRRECGSEWLEFPHMAKMAANGEKQQGHRPGIYKQKNKAHKNGRHRAKGEIERDNKGELCSATKCYLTTAVGCVVLACGSANTRVEFSGEFGDGVGSVKDIFE